MPLSFKIAGNTAIQIIGKFITAGITFVVTLIIARSYGAVGYGEFTKIMAFVSLFYLVVDFGLNAIFLQQKASPQPAKFASLFFTRLVWSGILVVIALIILVFLPFDPATNEGFNPLVKLGVIVLLPTIVTQALFISYNALFQSAMRYDKSVIAASLGSIATVSFVYLSSVIQLPLLFMVLGYTAGGVVLAFTASVLGKRYAGTIAGPLGMHLAAGKKLIAQGLPLGIALVLNLIQFKAAVFILTMFRTTVEVGVYGLATKLFEFPLAIPIFFMNAIYPLLLVTQHSNDANSDTKAQQKKQRVIRRSLGIMFVVSVLVGIVGVVLAPYIVLVKEEFVASVLPFRILMMFLPLFFISTCYVWILIADGARWVLSWVYGVGMAFNVALNLLTIPQFGVPAAVLATGITEGLILILLYINHPISFKTMREE